MDPVLDKIQHLCRLFIKEFELLHALSNWDASQWLLCASDFHIDTVRLRDVIRRLDRPSDATDHTQLALTIIRQLVFTRYNAFEEKRADFLDYWINRDNYRGLDIVAVSWLMNLAIDNIDLIDIAKRNYVRKWHLTRTNITNYRVVSWSVYCLSKAGYENEAQQRARALLGKRNENGSWDGEVHRTAACAYPLALSGVVRDYELESTLNYMLSRIGSQFDYGLPTRSLCLRTFKIIDRIPAALEGFIVNSILNAGSVFLSHTAADKPFVRRLARDLITHGVRVWVDEAEIHVGDRLVDKIEAGIEEMRYLAVVLSKNSVNSAWVGKELDLALIDGLKKREVRVLPLRLDEYPVPFRLRDLKYADFSTDYLQGLQQLLRRVRPEIF